MTAEFLLILDLLLSNTLPRLTLVVVVVVVVVLLSSIDGDDIDSLGVSSVLLVSLRLAFMNLLSILADDDGDGLLPITSVLLLVPIGLVPRVVITLVLVFVDGDDIDSLGVLSVSSISLRLVFMNLLKILADGRGDDLLPIIS